MHTRSPCPHRPSAGPGSRPLTSFFGPIAVASMGRGMPRASAGSNAWSPRGRFLSRGFPPGRICHLVYRHFDRVTRSGIIAHVPAVRTNGGPDAIVAALCNGCNSRSRFNSRPLRPAGSLPIAGCTSHSPALAGAHAEPCCNTCSFPDTGFTLTREGDSVCCFGPRWGLLSSQVHAPGQAL